MYFKSILTLDGNVYNFFSPDDSALDVIKKSHENQNVYKVNAEDVKFFFYRLIVSTFLYKRSSKS